MNYPKVALQLLCFIKCGRSPLCCTSKEVITFYAPIDCQYVSQIAFENKMR